MEYFPGAFKVTSCATWEGAGHIEVIGLAAAAHFSQSNSLGQERLKAAMKTRSKTEIIVETHRILAIKRGSRYRLAWCEECGEVARMVTADEAAILAGVSPRAVYQLVEARKLHFTESLDRVGFICLNSIGSLS